MNNTNFGRGLCGGIYEAKNEHNLNELTKMKRQEMNKKRIKKNSLNAFKEAFFSYYKLNKRLKNP